MSDQASVSIEGSVEPGFEAVREAFIRNFELHGEKGASVAVYVDGESVVDLWGGVADVTAGTPWSRDTLALSYSVTKGATSTLANLLAQRGELDLDRPVADFWPEFAAEGKGEVSTRDVLSHRAGLPVIDGRPSLEELIEGDPVTEMLAAQAPVWKPGSAHGYHALTFGWLMAGIIRRATGSALGDLFAELVADPLGIDFYIGCPASEHHRIAHQVNPPTPDPADIEAIKDDTARELVMRTIAAMMDPESLLSRALTSNGALPTPEAEAWSDPRIYMTEQPAANGITNGRSLAKMYASLVAEVDGVRLLGDDAIQEAAVEQSAGPDEVLLAESRFGTGYMLLSPVCQMLSESSFGHIGAGGAMGFADRDSLVGFGYVQNQLGASLTGEPRTEGLVEALRECLGAN